MQNSSFSLSTSDIPSIDLQPFLDIELDVSGWYALGHYHPEVFHDVVMQQELFYPVCIDEVRLGWARFEGNQFDFTTQPTEDYQPVTLVVTLT